MFPVAKNLKKVQPGVELGFHLSSIEVFFVTAELQHQHIGPHEEVEEQCDRWSGLQHHDGVVDVPVFLSEKYRKPWRCSSSTFIGS